MRFDFNIDFITFTLFLKELADMTKSKEGLEKENELLQDRLSASDKMIVSSAEEMRHLTDKVRNN